MTKIIFIFSTIYLSLVFPFAYFRHDDWLILVNAVRYLPEDWSFAWSPTLFYGNVEGTWFFRPFFKFIVYLCYRAFAYHYYLWVTSLLICVIGAVLLGRAAVKRISGSETSANLFAIAFFASFQIHFGSLVWIGEGMMNCPQMLLLAANAYFFCRGLGGERKYLWFAGLAYLMALGFKESGVLQSLLLGLIVLLEPKLNCRRFADKVLYLIPYAILTSVYLAFRLVAMPINPNYFSDAPREIVVKQILLLFASPAVVVVAYFLSIGRVRREFFGRFISETRARCAYLVLFLIAIFPYIGHGFFSPGWLYQPGFYFCFIFALLVNPFEAIFARGTYRRFGYVLGTFTLIPLAVVLVKVGWWQWDISGKQIHSIVASAKPDVAGITIFNCINPRYPDAPVNRTVGYPDSLSALWLLYHRELVPIKILYCNNYDDDFPFQVRHSPRGTLFFQWDFPRLHALNPKPFLLPNQYTRNEWPIDVRYFGFR